MRKNAKQGTVKKEEKSHNVFDRLVKKYTQESKEKDEDEEDKAGKKMFKSEFAKKLYKDMQELGDTETFKKAAHTRILNFKKDFKENMSRKNGLHENLAFTKEKYRHLNAYIPDNSAEQKELVKKLGNTVFNTFEA
mmetsp:Transcript_35554/g.32039  ORF Transcript_35554/g.32039 Transcript_35554/m.32039 type:complete len:136 (+) Transcript_35554:725-1132(+)